MVSSDEGMPAIVRVDARAVAGGRRWEVALHLAGGTCELHVVDTLTHGQVRDLNRRPQDARAILRLPDPHL